MAVLRPPVYLDFAASTPVDPAVAEAMHRVLSAPELAGNPSALTHAAGRAAHELIESARADVAALIGATPTEIIWTSGATEADNLAILGTARFRAARGRHLVTALSEHRAVVESFRQLEREGFRVTWLAPDAEGVIDPDLVAAALTAETTLVSLAHANNETGVLTDIGAVGSICRAHDVLLHVDAAQSAGRVAIDVTAQHVDLMSLSAHKLYGPKGVGALFVGRDRARRVEPLMYGGGQERGMRPGTLPTHQIVGMGVACRLARERFATDVPAVVALRDRLWQGVSAVPQVLRNGHPTARAPHILNVSVVGVEGESLLLALAGLIVSSGSACASLTGEPSPVLRLMGRAAPLAQSSVRFSLGRTTSAAEVDLAAQILAAAVARLRRIAPGRAA